MQPELISCLYNTQAADDNRQAADYNTQAAE